MWERVCESVSECVEGGKTEWKWWDLTKLRESRPTSGLIENERQVGICFKEQEIDGEHLVPAIRIKASATCHQTLIPLFLSCFLQTAHSKMLLFLSHSRRYNHHPGTRTHINTLILLILSFETTNAICEPSSYGPAYSRCFTWHGNKGLLHIYTA